MEIRVTIRTVGTAGQIVERTEMFSSWIRFASFMNWLSKHTDKFDLDVQYRA